MSASSAAIGALARALRAEIAKLPAVVAGPRSFRIGKKIFVRFADQPERVFLEFKLPPDEAERAMKHAFVRPMEFGGMGRHGWVEVSVTRKSQLPAVRRLVALSYSLYRVS